MSLRGDWGRNGDWGLIGVAHSIVGVNRYFSPAPRAIEREFVFSGRYCLWHRHWSRLEPAFFSGSYLAFFSGSYLDIGHSRFFEARFDIRVFPLRSDRAYVILIPITPMEKREMPAADGIICSHTDLRP